MKTNTTAKEQSLNPQPMAQAKPELEVVTEELDERVLKALHEERPAPFRSFG